MKLNYLDLSYCQTSVDYKKAAKKLSGVILRAGYGKGTPDNMFKKHYEGFSGIGVPIGVYWFSYAKTVEEARNEAEYCLKAIKGLKIELPVCYDFEYASVTNAKNAGVKVTKELASVMAEAFLSTIEKHGYYAMLYTSPDFKKTYYDDYLNKYDLWLANYVSNPVKPPMTCGIWQYGAGSWVGVAGEVDLNFAYKDYKTIIDKANLNHLHDPEPITHDQLALNWAYENDFLTKDELDVPATKGDIARMLYEYHMITTPEDTKTRSGALGG